MILKHLLVSLSLLPLLAFAGDEADPSPVNPSGSSLGLGADGGSESYGGLDVSGKIAIGPVLRFDFDASQYQLGTSGTTKNLAVGGDARLSPAVLLRAALLLGREPNDISSVGLRVGGDYTLSELWQSERETLVSFDFTANAYRQGSAPANGSKKLASRFRQREWTLGISQDFTEKWNMDFSASLYSYPSAPANLNSVVNNRRQRTAHFSGPVDGFPESSVGIGASYKIDGGWKPGLNFSHGRVVLTHARVDTFGASLSYDLSEAWTVGTHAFRTKQEYEAISWVGGLTAEYSF